MKTPIIPALSLNQTCAFSPESGSFSNFSNVQPAIKTNSLALGKSMSAVGVAMAARPVGSSRVVECSSECFLEPGNQHGSLRLYTCVSIEHFKL